MTNVRLRPTFERSRIEPPAYRALLDQFGSQVESAIDVFQVALLLESSGVNDLVARERYQATDVVDLAVRVTRSVPYRAVRPTYGRRRWLGPGLLSLLRGSAFVFAGLIAMTAAATTAGRASGLALLAASMAATTLMSPLSFLAHLVTERAGDTGRAAAVAPLYRLGLGAIGLVGIVVGLTSSWADAAMVVAPLLYAEHAVVATVIRRHLLFVVALFPGGIAALLYLASNGSILSADVALITSVVGLSSLFGIVLVMMRHRGRLRDGVGRWELRSAVPFLWTGLSTATFVGALVLCVARMGPLEASGAHGWFIAALPMLVVLMLSDLLASVYRRDSARAASRSISTGQFRSLLDRAAMKMWLLVAVTALVGLTPALVLVPIHGVVLRLLIPVTFLVGGLVMMARLADPDPYDRFGSVAVASLVPPLAVLAAVAPSLKPEYTDILTIFTLAAGFVAVEANAWRRSRSLAVHRWTL